MKNVISTIAVASACIAAATQTGFAANAMTYVCVEERSVGWEPRDNAPDAVGQFEPDKKPVIVRYYPPKIEDEKIVVLGKIEVTEDGKTSTFTSNACATTLNDILQHREFGINRGVDDYRAQCASRVDYLSRNPGFGSDDHRFWFGGDIGAGKSPVRYTETLVFGVVWAYVQQGTCTALPPQ